MLFSFMAGNALAAMLAAALFVIGHLLRSLHDLAAMTEGPGTRGRRSLPRAARPRGVQRARRRWCTATPCRPAQIALATVYGLGWILVFLLLARVVFDRREL